MLLLASIPVLLLLFGRKYFPGNIQLGLCVLSIPFVLMVAFYAVIIALCVGAALFVIYHLKNWLDGRQVKLSPTITWYRKRP